MPNLMSCSMLHMLIMNWPGDETMIFLEHLVLYLESGEPSYQLTR